MRVVFDTNVLISAFNFPGGPPEDLYRAALSGRLTLITSPPLLAELGRVLTQKFSWDPGRTEEAVTQVVRNGLVVRPKRRQSVAEDDPADDRVLEAAEEGRAEAIVSGDRHLLRLRSWEGIRILRASTLLDEIA